jgi:hypothetical protein
MLLPLMLHTTQNQWDVIQKAKCQVSLMEELLISTTTSHDILQKQIEELKEKEHLADTIMTPPPARDPPGSRNTRERSKKVSESEE